MSDTPIFDVTIETMKAVKAQAQFEVKTAARAELKAEVLELANAIKNPGAQVKTLIAKIQRIE